MVEVVLGVMSAFQAHKWILQAASYLLCIFSRILLSICSCSPFPVITAVGLCLVVIGICPLQDEEDVIGAERDGKRDSVDCEADVDKAEDGSPMEKDSSTKTEEEEIDQKEEESERDVFIATLLDQLVANAAKDGLSFKGSLESMASSKTEAEL